MFWPAYPWNLSQQPTWPIRIRNCSCLRDGPRPKRQQTSPGPSIGGIIPRHQSKVGKMLGDDRSGEPCVVSQSMPKVSAVGGSIPVAPCHICFVATLTAYRDLGRNPSRKHPTALARSGGPTGLYSFFSSSRTNLGSLGSDCAAHSHLSSHGSVSVLRLPIQWLRATWAGWKRPDSQ